MKKPLLAAFLNLIPGLGYLYLQTRQVFGVILLISSIVGSIPFIIFFESYQVVDPWILASSTILQVGFMVDVYLIAKQQNKKS